METKMTIKKTKLAGILAAALSLAAPLAIGATPADAAPMHGGMTMTVAMHDTMGHGDFSRDRDYRDRDHRPPLRIEYRAPAPRGHFHWHAGGWSWGRGHWVWNPGAYARF
jgi:hypothetical protein